MRFAFLLLTIVAATPLQAQPSGSGGWPGIHAAPPRIGPAPSPRLASPSATISTPRPRTELPLGTTPLQGALAAPAPQVDTERGAAATQRAVDDLMGELGVHGTPQQGPPPGVRCGRWDRNLQTCLD